MTLAFSSLNARASWSRYPGHSFWALKHWEHAGSIWSHLKNSNVRISQRGKRNRWGESAFKCTLANLDAPRSTIRAPFTWPATKYHFRKNISRICNLPACREPWKKVEIVRKGYSYRPEERWLDQPVSADGWLHNLWQAIEYYLRKSLALGPTAFLYALRTTSEPQSPRRLSQNAIQEAGTLGRKAYAAHEAGIRSTNDLHAGTAQRMRLLSNHRYKICQDLQILSQRLSDPKCQNSELSIQVYPEMPHFEHTTVKVSEQARPQVTIWFLFIITGKLQALVQRTYSCIP